MSHLEQRFRYEYMIYHGEKRLKTKKAKTKTKKRPLTLLN